MKIIAIANQKGGVGKTTIATHLAHRARELGKRVLLVDLDRQGNLSQSFPPVQEGTPAGLSASLFGAGDVVPEILEEGLAILRADESLSLLDGSNSHNHKAPAARLRALADDYDVCIVDTPGVLGFNPPMTIAALIAADAVVCPFGVGVYEAKALGDLWQYLRNIRANGYNPKLRVLGLLPSKVNTTSREEKALLAELRSAFGDKILPYILGERAAVKQAIAKGRPVWKGVRGAGHKVAAQEWLEATTYILQELEK